MSNQEEVRRNIGLRLKEAREYLGFSQDEVAKSLKIPRPAISLIESGERKVEALELKKFADLYQQPVDYFISGKSEVSEGNKELAFLARTATKLTQEDREELLRFAQFLQAKSKGKVNE
jgi:transcriptional regulator with XRE-family HTH domain